MSISAGEAAAVTETIPQQCRSQLCASICTEEYNYECVYLDVHMATHLHMHVHRHPWKGTVISGKRKRMGEGKLNSYTSEHV